MKCEALKRECSGCGHRFTKWGPKIPCPECGVERSSCGHKAVAGYKFCRFHGGPNPKNNFYGLGGRMLKSGENSGFPLTRLASKYMEMKQDGRLLSNRASLEVIRDRISQLAERIDLDKAPDRLENIRKLWEKYKLNKGFPDEKVHMQEVDEEFERAYHDYASWKQMFEAIDLDRKLVESEVKIIKDIRAVLTAEDAYELTAQLLAAIISTTNSMEGVDDHIKLNFLKRIQYEFTRVVGDRINKGPGGGGREVDTAEGGELD